MKSSQPFRLFNIPILLHPSWFFIVFYLTWTLSQNYYPSVYGAFGFGRGAYWVMGLVSALLLFICILLHEMGHSLMARRYGIPVSCVTLFLFGGVAQIAGEVKRPSIEFHVALAGPLVSALLAWSCFSFARIMPIQTTAHIAVYAVLRYLALINTAVLVFNLLPAFPLDGGRVLRAALWLWSGNVLWATQIASAIGIAFGYCLLAVGVWMVLRGSWGGGVWYLILGWFLRNASMANYHFVKHVKTQRYRMNTYQRQG